MKVSMACKMLESVFWSCQSRLGRPPFIGAWSSYRDDFTTFSHRDGCHSEGLVTSDDPISRVDTEE